MPMREPIARVAPEQRFRGARRCLICGGADDDPRGNGTRCYGFRSAAGAFVQCTREQFAGALSLNGSGAYAHRLGGACGCGQFHEDADLLRNREMMRGRVADRHNGASRGTVTRFDLKDATGVVVAVHARRDLPVPATRIARIASGSRPWQSNAGAHRSAGTPARRCRRRRIRSAHAQ
jgi:hypothetical protein